MGFIDAVINLSSIWALGAQSEMLTCQLCRGHRSVVMHRSIAKWVVGPIKRKPAISRSRDRMADIGVGNLSTGLDRDRTCPHISACPMQLHSIGPNSS